MLCIEAVLTSPATLLQLQAVGFSSLVQIQLDLDFRGAVANGENFNVSGMLVFQGYGAHELDDAEMVYTMEQLLVEELQPCGFYSLWLENYFFDNSTTSLPLQRSRRRRLRDEDVAMKRYVISGFDPFRNTFTVSSVAPTTTTTPTTEEQPTTTSSSSSPDLNAQPGDSLLPNMEDSMLLIILVSVLGGLLILIVFVVVVWCCCCRKKTDSEKRKKVASRPLQKSDALMKSAQTPNSGQGEPDVGIELLPSTTFASTRHHHHRDELGSKPGANRDSLEPSELLANFVPAEWLRDYQPSSQRSTIFLKPSTTHR